MASHDSSSSPPPLHPHHHHQQPPLLHHYHHHPQQQQQPSQTILMAPPQQFDVTSYPINPYQHYQQQPLYHQPLYDFNQVVTDGGGARDESSSPHPADGVGFNLESTKRKRGRPRKNPIDGEGNYRVDLGVSPDPGTPVKSSKIPAVRVRDSTGGGGTQTSEKRRGRPPGSVKKQIDSLGSSGTGFTPHVIIVNAGEDVASKVVQFMQQGSRTMYVMSANGSTSNCTLQQPGTDIPVTLEGKYEIVSLSGSSMLSESPNGLIRVGGLSVLLAGPDCIVIGGVAERLIAYAEVKVVIGSFIVDVKKPKLTSTASQASIASNADVVQLSFGGDQAGYGGDQLTVGASQQSGDGACSYDNSDGENNNSEANNGGGGCYDNSGQQQQQQQMQKIPISLPMYGGWESSAKVVETTFPDVF